MQSMLENEPLVTQKQYIVIDDRETMRPITRVRQEGAILLLACRIGSVRLIDVIYCAEEMLKTKKKLIESMSYKLI